MPWTTNLVVANTTFWGRQVGSFGWIACSVCQWTAGMGKNWIQDLRTDETLGALDNQVEKPSSQHFLLSSLGQSAEERPSSCGCRSALLALDLSEFWYAPKNECTFWNIWRRRTPVGSYVECNHAQFCNPAKQFMQIMICLPFKKYVDSDKP